MWYEIKESSSSLCVLEGQKGGKLEPKDMTKINKTSYVWKHHNEAEYLYGILKSKNLIIEGNIQVLNEIPFII